METEKSTSCGETRTMLDLVGLLYDAAADPARWRVFLEAGAHHFVAFGANLIHFRPDYPERSLAMLTGMGDISTENLADAVTQFVNLREEDPRLRHGFLHPNKPFHCRQVVSTETLHGSRSYREVLGPNGVEYTLLVTFDDTPGAFTGLAFMRNSDAQPFSDADVTDMGELVPHIRRVLAIQDRLGQIVERRHDAYSVLESLPTGIAILGAGGMVEFANGTARDLLARGDGLTIEDGVLRAYRRNGIDLLAALLCEVAVTGEHRALAVERPSGQPAFRCLLSRLWRNVGEGLPNLLARPKVVCYVGDPDQPLETPAEILQRLFGLTFGEARLAERLVAGDTLVTAASRLGIRESTARDRLKSVFAKTETTGQPDLLRTILNSPAWVAGRTMAISGCLTLGNR